MTKLIGAFLFFISATAFAQTDEEAIKQTITASYIDGIQNRGDVAVIRKGFHPSFTMLRSVDNEIKPFTLEEWISNLEKSKASGEPAPPKAEGKFIQVDVTGTAAVVKLELYRAGKKNFTDYLVLYKFNEGWRIVSKTFFRHP